MSKTNKEKILAEIKEAFLSVDAKAVRQRVEKKTDYFLNEEILRLKQKKKIFIPVLMLSFVMVFFLFSFFGVRFIEAKNQKEGADLGISDFATIDIQDAAFKIGNLEDKVNDLSFKKDKIIREKKKILKELEDKYAFDLELLKEEEITLNLFEEKLKALKEEFNKIKSQKNAFYNRKIKKITKDLSRNEQLILAEKKKNKNIIGDSVVDNNKRLMKLKIQEAVDMVLSDLKSAEKRHGQILLQRKKRFDTLVRNLKNKYENKIDSYRKSINYYMHRTGQVGIVLNIQGDVLQLYIHPLYARVKHNTKAHVIGKNDNLKAEILVRKKGSSFEGEIVKWFSDDEASKKIESLDSIVLFL